MTRHHRLSLVLATLLPAALCWSAAAATRIHFVAGPPSHGWGNHEHVQGCQVLANALRNCGQDLEAVVHTNGWPKADALTDADALIIYSDGADDHVAGGHEDVIRALWSRGCGLGVFHFALEGSGPAMSALWTDAIGGCFETNWSVNPLWTMTTPILAADHPVTRGVNPFEMKDEWYYHMRFRKDMANVEPVLSTVPPLDSIAEEDDPHMGNPAVRAAVKAGELQHLLWTSTDGKGRRGLGFTGGHIHANWLNNDYRTLVLNGIAWVAGIEVPAEGIRSATPAVLRHKTLTKAVAMDDAEDVARHIAAGADVNAQSKSGFSPLHHAAVRGKVVAGKALLAKGADPNLKTKSGKTPLHFCGERGFAELAEVLIAAGARLGTGDQENWTPLHYAAERDKLEVATLLVKKGAPIDALSVRGGSPLHEAAASAGKEMIQLLLNAGAKPDLKAQNGKTPLDYAIEMENEAAQLLLKAAK